MEPCVIGWMTYVRALLVLVMSYLLGAWSMYHVLREHLDAAKAHLDEVDEFLKRTMGDKP